MIFIKVYEKYKELKINNSSMLYLFKVGNFYIFVDEDARYISGITTLKVTAFGNTIKCGFPLRSYDKYKRIFDNLNIKIKLIENRDDVIKQIAKSDLNNLSKEELILIIERLINCI